MKNIIKRILVLAMILLLVSCDKQRNFEVNFGSTITLKETNAVDIEASINSSETLEHRGILYSVDSNLTIDSYSYAYSPYNDWGKILDETNSLKKTYVLDDLQPQMTYYFRLFAIFNGAIKYGEIKTFKSGCVGLGCGPAGGQIIYEDGNGGGIEVASNFVTPTRRWGNNQTVNTQNAIGAGLANTTAIINESGTNTLAQLCADYTQSGFSDYYMPSIEELELIHQEVFVKANNPNFWSAVIYFSSSQASFTTCWAYNFASGSTATYNKSSTNFATIPVRTF